MYNDYLTLDNYEELARAYSKLLSKNNVTYLKTKNFFDENFVVNKLKENLSYFNIILKNTSIISNQCYVNNLIKKYMTILSSFNQEKCNVFVFSTNKCESIKNILKNNFEIIKKLQFSEKKYLINELLDISAQTINLIGNCKYLF